MPTDISYISGQLSIIANILTLIVGLFYCYRAHNPSYLRIFPVYLFGSIAEEFFANSNIFKLFNYKPFGIHQKYAAIASYNLYTPFELFMFAWFLYQVIQSSRIKRLLIILLLLFSLLFIIYYRSVGVGERLNSISVILESIILIIPCLTWYQELFARNESINLFGEPAFWLVSGIFFYLATIIPYLLVSMNWMNEGLYGKVKILSSINNLSLIIT
jgi:hypothetical protein